MCVCLSSGCSLPLGLQRNLIPDSSFSASSFHKSMLRVWSPSLARLHLEGGANAWRPMVSKHTHTFTNTCLLYMHVVYCSPKCLNERNMIYSAVKAVREVIPSVKDHDVVIVRLIFLQTVAA